MRIIPLLACSWLLGACSFLDAIEISGSPSPNPNKIYLGTARVTAHNSRDLERYACIDGPMFCDYRGTRYECRCP